jgi:hypothetical protein
MMQLFLIVLTKRKEMTHYCETIGTGGTTLSNIIANDLMHVSVPTKNRPIIPNIWAFHIIPIIWAFHFIPNTWAFHINVLQLRTNNQLIPNKKRKHTQVLIVLQRHKQPNKFINNKRRLTHQNHRISSLM